MRGMAMQHLNNLIMPQVLMLVLAASFLVAGLELQSLEEETTATTHTIIKYGFTFTM